MITTLPIGLLPMIDILLTEQDLINLQLDCIQDCEECCYSIECIYRLDISNKTLVNT